MLNNLLPFVLLAAPEVALAPLFRLSCKGVSALFSSSDDLLGLSVAPVGFNPSLESNSGPTISDTLGLGRLACCLRIK